jgi:hypothetical protein
VLQNRDFFLLWRRDLLVLELQLPTPLRVVLLCFATQSADRSVMVASRLLGAVKTIVFCSWISEIVLEWLHQGCDSDLSADFLNFGASNFPFKNPFKKCFKIVFFSLWRRDPVLELQFPMPLRVILLCFATESLQIALEWLRQGCLAPRLRT